MHIFFYTPFKPLDHPAPSGDLVIAKGLVRYLQKRGHRVTPVSRLRSRWITQKPWLLPLVLREKNRVYRMARKHRPDIWLTYHTYYKAPDLLGPGVCRRFDRLPYLIFQGNYATKRRRKLKTVSGFYLNRHALRSARHVFINRREDYVNLARILPRARLTYAAPGIYPSDFIYNPNKGKQLRAAWGMTDAPVMVSAAMFRADVKTEGLAILIRASARLQQQGLHHHLAVAGDGREKQRLQRLASACGLRKTIRFVGRLPRSQMAHFYSAGNFFAFPGINESLGMVYLEAQSCGLPVVAFDNGGIPEVVDNGKTGILTPLKDESAFTAALKRFITNPPLCREMGRRGAAYIRENHDLDRNYRQVETVLCRYQRFRREHPRRE